MEDFMWSLKGRCLELALAITSRKPLIGPLNIRKKSDDESVQQEEKDKKELFLTVTEVTKNIRYFDGSNEDPLTYITSCEDALEQIHPLDIMGLTIKIRSKIIGEADYALRHTDLNFDDIMMEIKRVFVPKENQEFEGDIFKAKQKIYENPITFGKRLLRVLQYMKEEKEEEENYDSLLAEMEIAEKTAVERYIQGIQNNEMRKELKKKEPKCMIECIEIAEKIWECINHRHSLNPGSIFPTNGKHCLFCNIRKYHYYDCPFKNNWQVDYSVRRKKIGWDSCLKTLNDIPFIVRERLKKDILYNITELPFTYCQICKRPGHPENKCLLYKKSQRVIKKITEAWENDFLNILMLRQQKLEQQQQQRNNKFCKTCKRIKNPTSEALKMRIQTFCSDCSNDSQTDSKRLRKDNKRSKLGKSKRVEKITKQLSKLTIKKL